jgi:hypothetical protein
LNAGDQATINGRHYHAAGIERLDGDCGLGHGLEASKSQYRLCCPVGFRLPLTTDGCGSDKRYGQRRLLCVTGRGNETTIG